MRRGLRIALVAIAVFAVALVAGAGAFLAGLEVSGEFLRAPLERALTAVFGVPTRIEGPLKLQTGLSTTVSADALVLADPSGSAGATLARGTRPRARIDLVAFLRRVIALDEVTGERLDLTLIRRADGRANWAPIFAASPDGGKSPVSFGGIARLRIGSVAGSYQREGAAPVPFAIAALDGALPLREPTTARGSVLVAGQPVAFDLRSASFAELAGSAAAFALQGTVQWSGMRATVEGDLARDGSRFDAGIRASADDASLPLAALGIAASEPGRLELRMHLGMTATEATVRDLSVTLGKTVASGSASIAWSAPRWRMTADIAGERIDLEPFAFAKSLPQDKTAPEAILELLERTATGADAEVRLAVGELVGLPVKVQDLGFDGRSRDSVVGARGNAIVSGTRVEARLDYDARKPQRTLTARVDGGGASAAELPGRARPRELSGSVAGMRGQLRARGETAHGLVASVEASLEARDLRWTLDLRRGSPLSGRFDLMRVAVQGTRASSAEVAGRLGDAACSLTVSGGALAPLLDGEPWPLQIAGSCPGGRLSAKGRLAFVQRQVVGELAFDAAGDRIGPVAQALGVAWSLPHPVSARGTLVLDEKLARARFDALRLGRTAGSGQVALARGADGAPRVQLALTTLDLDELNAVADPGPVPEARSERVVLRRDMRLPDVDFDITADRVAIADANLRRLQFAGAVRSRKMPPAPFRFEWEGVPISGQFGADFSGAAPRIEIDGTAHDADLQPLLARFGQADVGLRTGAFSLRGRAQGVRLGELLANMTLSATIDRGQLDLPERTSAGLSGRSEFSATLNATAGQPTRLAARGTFDGEPMDLAVDASALADLLRADGAIPLTLRLTLGDVRLEGAGKISGNGTGEGRLQVSGGRLDRLGRLIGVRLPEVGPYAASGNVAVSAGATRVDDLDASFGRSRLVGDLKIERKPGGRSLHRAELRAPALHLEDIGADHWLHDGERPETGEAAQRPTARTGQQGAERLLEFLRTADINATVDVEALHGAGEKFASGRLRAVADAAVLHFQLQDVRTAGGELDADSRVDAGAAPPKFGVRMRVRDVEFGPLLRALDPGSKMAGKLDVVADLVAQAPWGKLAPALAGTIDIAGYPRGLYSPALGLWGAGLLNALLRQLDPDSRSAVECGVTSVDIDGGVARSTAFFVDTTRVRVIGEFEIDLTTRALSGRIDPVSKQPRFLAFAPTMLLGGTIDSPRVTGAPENIFTVPLRLATSLAPFALDWRTLQGRAREGAEGCREAFERIRQGRAGTQ